MLGLSNQNRCQVLNGVGIGTTVFVWIDAAIFPARYQGRIANGNVALFSVGGVLLRVPCNQIRAIFT